MPRSTPVGPTQAKRDNLSTSPTWRKPVTLMGLGIASLAMWIVGLVFPASILANHESIARNVPLRQILGEEASGLLWYVASFAAIWTMYFLAVAVARTLTGRTATRIAAAIAVLLVIAGLLVYPGGSRDIWHNVADGRLLWLHGQNPLVTAPSEFQDTDSVIAQVTAFQNEPTYYGPLWYVLTAGPALLAGDSVPANLVAFKLLPAIFFLLGLPLVYRVAERARPGSGAAALVVYGWNPLLIFFGPTDGHNDIIMGFFMLAALHEGQRDRWWSSIPLLLLGALVKYLAILLLPIIVVWAMKRNGKAAIRQLAVGLAIGAALAVAIWAPFWEGPATLEGLRTGSDRAMHSLLATIMFLIEPTRRSGAFPPVWLRTVFTVAFLVVAAGVILLYVRRDDARFETAVLASLAMLFGYLVTQSWWFFPWYLGWFIPVAATLAYGRAATFAGIYGATATALLGLFGWAPIFNPTLAEYSLVALILLLGPPTFYLVIWADSSTSGTAKPASASA